MNLKLFIPDDTEEPEGDPFLFEAAKYGDVERVRERLAAGAAVDGRRERRETALMIAAVHGHVEVFETLLDAGADPYLGVEPGPYGDGALTMACRFGRANIVRKWIERGLDVRGNESNLVDPLVQAASNGDVEIVQLLIDAGESRLDDPLAAAASSGHVEIMRLLIESGADVNAEYSDRNTPLACALVNDEHEAASVLKEAGAIMHADCGYAKDIRDLNEPADEESVDFAAAASGSEFQELVRVMTELNRHDPSWTMHPSEDLPGVWQIDVARPHVEYEFRELQMEVLGKGYHLIRNSLSLPGDPMTLLLFPTHNKYAILAALETNGENYGISDRQVRRWLRELEQVHKHPFDLWGAGIDFVDGHFTKPVKSPRQLARHIYEFCPDIVDQGCGSVDALADELAMTGRLVLWWD